MPNNLFVGINVSGLYFMSADKEVYYCFSLFDIKAHSCLPSMLKLVFEKDYIELITDKAEEFVSLLIDYKYHHLKSDL